MARPSVVLIPENIPQVLKSQKRWAVYKLEPRKGQPGKYNKAPRDGFMKFMEGWNTDRSKWMEFNEALTTQYGRSDCDGYGIFLGTYEGKQLWALDLDDQVIDGYISPRAQEIIDAMDSYTEYSPSGNGLRILFYSNGDKVPGSKHKSEDGKIELYGDDDSPRFMTITGNIAPHCQKQIGTRSPRDAYKFVDPEAFEKPGPQGQPSSVATNDRPAGKSSKTPKQVINEMFWLFPNSRKLWDGDISGQDNDHSKADFVLCRYLVGVCDGDKGLIDEVFQSSGLNRPKWDEKHGQQTYGEMTIDRAIDGNGSDVEPFDFSRYRNHVKKRVLKALEEYDTADMPKTLLNSVDDAKPFSGPRALALDNLSDFMETGFDDEVANFTKHKGISTGWNFLDSKLESIFPGLYVLGAAPGSGKTTWAWQLFNNLAAMGYPCIVFTLEQSKLELVSKSLARHIFIASGARSGLKKKNIPTSKNIRTGWGAGSEELEQAKKEFSQAARNLFVVEGSLELDVETVKATVEEYITRTGKRPFVFIDYLQLLTTSDKYLQRDKRACTDYVVKVLKNLQRDNQLAMFVITSYSRDNYGKKTELSSSKESGGIEYTADVVLGLDLACLYESKDPGELWEKTIERESKSHPSRLLLTCVKNRLGEKFQSAFNYYWRHDCYIEPIDEPMPTEDYDELYDGIEFQEV